MRENAMMADTEVCASVTGSQGFCWEFQDTCLIINLILLLVFGLFLLEGEASSPVLSDCCRVSSANGFTAALKHIGGLYA